MLILYAVAAVLLGISLCLWAVRGILKDRLDDRLLRLHYNQARDPRVLPTLVDLRRVDRPIVIVPSRRLAERKHRTTPTDSGP